MVDLTEGVALFRFRVGFDGPSPSESSSVAAANTSLCDPTTDLGVRTLEIVKGQDVVETNAIRKWLLTQDLDLIRRL